MIGLIIGVAYTEYMGPRLKPVKGMAKRPQQAAWDVANVCRASSEQFR